MDEKAPPPGWIGLLLAGISNLVYGLVNFIWSLLSLLWGGFAAVRMTLDSTASGSSDIAGTVMAVIIALSPIINVLVFFFIPLLALITLFAALRFKSFRSKGLVWLGILIAIASPILAFLASFTSLCNVTACVGCCLGFVGGNALTIVDFVVVLLTTGFAVFALTRRETAAAFAAEAA